MKNDLRSVPDICRDVTSKAAAWIGCSANKFGGAQPVSMTKDNIRFLNEKKYMVSYAIYWSKCSLKSGLAFLVNSSRTQLEIQSCVAQLASFDPGLA